MIPTLITKSYGKKLDKIPISIQIQAQTANNNNNLKQM